MFGFLYGEGQAMVSPDGRQIQGMTQLVGQPAAPS
jgi:hypothetical protein